MGGVSKNSGKTPKMDGENKGKPNPMNKWMIWGGFGPTPIFGLTPIFLQSPNYDQLHSAGAGELQVCGPRSG